MSEWISVKDSVPNDFDTVLIFAWGRTIFTAYRIKGKWELDGPASMPDIEIIEVTHWMELPEPPK